MIVVGRFGGGSHHNGSGAIMQPGLSCGVNGGSRRQLTMTGIYLRVRSS